MSLSDRDKDHIFGVLERILRLNLIVVKAQAGALMLNEENRKIIKEVEEFLNK